jgi:hypothetical protein
MPGCDVNISLDDGRLRADGSVGGNNAVYALDLATQMLGRDDRP